MEAGQKEVFEFDLSGKKEILINQKDIKGFFESETDLLNKNQFSDEIRKEEERIITPHFAELEPQKKPPILPISSNKKRKLGISNTKCFPVNCFQSLSMHTSEKERIMNTHRDLLQESLNSESRWPGVSSYLNSKEPEVVKLSQVSHYPSSSFSEKFAQKSMDIGSRIDYEIPDQNEGIRVGDFSYSKTPATRSRRDQADSSIRSLKIESVQDSSNVFSYFKRKFGDYPSTGGKDSDLVREELDLKDSLSSQTKPQDRVALKLNMADSAIDRVITGQKFRHLGFRSPTGFFNDITITKADRNAIQKAGEKFHRHIRQKTGDNEKEPLEGRNSRILGRSFNNEMCDNVILTESDIKRTSSIKGNQTLETGKESRLLKQLRRLQYNIQVNTGKVPDSKISPFYFKREEVEKSGQIKGKDLLQHIKMVKKNIIEGLKKNYTKENQSNKENKFPDKHSERTENLLERQNILERGQRKVFRPLEQNERNQFQSSDRGTRIERSLGSIKKSIERMKFNLDTMSLNKSELHDPYKKALLTLPIQKMSNNKSFEKRANISQINTKRTTMETLGDYLTSITPLNNCHPNINSHFLNTK